MDNFTPDIPEKLVQYLDGELSGAEKDSLEQQLASDKAMQDELDSLKSTREAVRLYGLKQKVTSIHDQMMKELQPPVKKISPVRRMVRYSIAVAASVILIATGIFAYNFFTLSADKLFASNYHPYELSNVRDNNSPDLSTLESAYQGKKYTEVIGIVYDRPFTIKESFLRAVSYVELNNNTNAITELKKVIAENETAKTNQLKDEAEYYLALTYIRNGDYDFALDLMQKIKNDPNHLYHEKITGKLIRKVKMLKWR